MVCWLVLAFCYIPSALCQVCQGGRNAIVYTNGISTTDEDALDSLTVLARELDGRLGTEIDRSCLDFRIAYNGRFTTSDGKVISWVSTFDQIMESGLQLGIDVAANFWTYWQAPTGIQVPAWFADAHRIAILAATSAFQPELLAQERSYSQLLGQGDRIVTVAHSQGNLFANQAHSTVTAFGGSDRFKVIAVATPASRVAGDGPWVTLHGDIITLVPTNKGPNYRNESPQVCPQSASILDSRSVDCHRFVESYLAGDMTRPAILSAVSSAISSPSTNPSSYRVLNLCAALGLTNTVCNVSPVNDNGKAVVTHPSADGSYQAMVVDIYTLQTTPLPAEFTSVGGEINNLGQVLLGSSTGTSVINPDGNIWRMDRRVGSAEILGNSGRVIAYLNEDRGKVPRLWGQLETDRRPIQPIAEVDPGGSINIEALNALDTVVGSVSVTDLGVPFVWDSTIGMRLLPLPDDSIPRKQGAALAINRSGDIFGYVWRAGSCQVPYGWLSDGRKLFFGASNCAVGYYNEAVVGISANDYRNVVFANRATNTTDSSMGRQYYLWRESTGSINLLSLVGPDDPGKAAFKQCIEGNVTNGDCQVFGGRIAISNQNVISLGGYILIPR
jgi:hypothetical protein